MRETGREPKKARRAAGAHAGLTQVMGSSKKTGESLEPQEMSDGFSKATGESLSPSGAREESLSSQQWGLH